MGPLLLFSLSAWRLALLTRLPVLPLACCDLPLPSSQLLFKMPTPQVPLAREIIEQNQKGRPVHRIPEVDVRW